MGGTVALLLYVVGMLAFSCYNTSSSWDEGYRHGWKDRESGKWDEGVKRRPQDYD